MSAAFREERIDLDAFEVLGTNEAALVTVVAKEGLPVLSQIRPVGLRAVGTFLFVGVRKVCCNVDQYGTCLHTNWFVLLSVRLGIAIYRKSVHVPESLTQDQL